MDAHLDYCAELVSAVKWKDPAAVELGRLGGSAMYGKPKGLASLTPEAREAIRAKGLATRRAAQKTR